jgi:peptidoglycan/LPS O-acetylase OafA/YrhL
MKDKTTAANKREYFIDVARVLAFSSVVIGHKFWVDFLDVSRDGNPNLTFTLIMKPAFAGGGAGIVLFFLVSGYVITKALTRENFTQFIFSRFFRIYPSLWLALAVYWLFQANGTLTAPTMASMVSSMSLFGDFFQTPNQLNGVDWTLRVEILFYFCCAIWLVIRKFLPAASTEWKDWSRRISYVLIFIVLLNLPTFPKNGFTGYVSIFSFVFLGGIWLAMFDMKKVSMLETVLVLLSSFIAHSRVLSEIRPDLFGFGAFSLYGYAAFIILFVFRHKIRPSQTLILISSLTYLVYLFHNWLLDYFFTWFQFLPANLDGRVPFISRFVSFLLFLGLMWIIHLCFEKPIMKFGKRVSSKSKRYSQ